MNAEIATSSRFARLLAMTNVAAGRWPAAFAQLNPFQHLIVPPRPSPR
jgi:hypothetical protein